MIEDVSVRMRAAAFRADLQRLAADAHETEVGEILASSLREEFGETARALVVGVDGSSRKPDYAFEVSRPSGKLSVAVEFKLYRTRKAGAGELDRGIGQCAAYAQRYGAVFLVAVFMGEPQEPLPSGWRSNSPVLYLERGERRVPLFLLGRPHILTLGGQASAPAAGTDEDDFLEYILTTGGTSGPASAEVRTRRDSVPTGFLERVAAGLGLAPPTRRYVTTMYRGISIGIDDSAVGRRVHAFTHDKQQRHEVNSLLRRGAPQIGVLGMRTIYSQLSDRIALGDPVYIGWEWNKTKPDAEEANMALHLVAALKAIIDHV